jgi:hypothetical protein
LIALQLLYCYAPIANTASGSAAIGPREWLLTAALAVVIFLLTEVAKAVTRRSEVLEAHEATGASTGLGYVTMYRYK